MALISEIKKGAVKTAPYFELDGNLRPGRAD
jgi:hypothetical protein